MEVETGRWSLRHLDTGYFSVVMSTEIISVSLSYHGFSLASAIMFWIGVAAYALLSVSFIARMMRHLSIMRRDAADPSKAFGYYNILTASSVVIVRWLRFSPFQPEIANTLLLILAACWILISAGVIPLMTGRGGSVGVNKKSVSSWFASMVAAEGISILSSTVFRLYGGGTLIGIASLAYWITGSALFYPITFLVAVRTFRGQVHGNEVLGPYWINMGGGAIIGLSGYLILHYHLVSSSFTVAAVSMVIYASLAYGAAWIPILVFMSYRTLSAGKNAMRYSPSMWSIVFPIGMMSASAYVNASGGRAGLVTGFSYVMLLIAILCWILVATSLTVAFFGGDREILSEPPL